MFGHTSKQCFALPVLFEENIILLWGILHYAEKGGMYDAGPPLNSFFLKSVVKDSCVDSF